MPKNSVIIILILNYLNNYYLLQISGLKYYSDASLDSKVIMPHLPSSEIGMQIQRLLRLVPSDNELMI